MRRLRKRLMAILLTMVMVCSLLSSGGYTAFAATEHEIINPTITISIIKNGTETVITDWKNYVFNNGDQISINIGWEISNIDNVIKPGDTLIYNLQESSGIDLTSTTGNVVDNKIDIGTYSIVDNEITITITNEDVFGKNNIKGGLDIEATIDAADTNVDNLGQTTAKLLGQDIKVQVVDPKSQPTVNKRKGTVYSEGGKNYQSFTVEVTENGTGKSLDIVDTLGAHYTYKADSFKVNGAAEVPTINGQKISYKLESVTKGQKYIITYDVEIADAAYNNEFSWYLPDTQYHNDVTVTNSNNISNSSSTFGLTYKVWVNKLGNFDSNTGLINWTVVVNDGDSIDISGATIKDVIPAGLEMVGDATITSSKTNKSVNVSRENLESGYEFPENSVGKYTITYKTKVTASTKGMSATTYTNEANFKDNRYNADSTDSDIVPVSYNWINKSVASVDKNAQEINWQTVITVPSTQTTPVSLDFSDVFGTGLTYKAGSFKVDYTGLTVTGKNSGAVTSTATGLEADLGQVTYKAGGDNRIIITYTTTYDPDGADTVTFTNTAKVSDDVTSQTDDASYTYEEASVKAIEYKRYEKIDGTKVTWALQVKVPDSINNKLDGNDHIYLYDTPTLVDSNGNTVDTAGFSLVEGSISVQDGVAPNGLIKAEKLTDGRIRFDITEYQKTYKKNYYNLYYTLALDSDTAKGIATDTSGKSYSMYNTVSASLYDGDVEDQKLGTIEQKLPAAISVGDILTKTYKYNDTTKFNAEYTVEINPDGLDLASSSGSIRLEDELGKNLSIDLSTVKLTDGSGNLITGYTPSYDSATRKLTIYNIPDETPCTLTYTVLVNVDYSAEYPTFESQAGTIDVDNVCTLYVDDSQLVQNGVGLSGNIYQSSAWATSDYNSITLFKHNELFVGLSGAQFTITAYKVENETMVPYTVDEFNDAYGGGVGYTVGPVTTPDGGKKVINLRSDMLYEIKETTPPAGYVSSGQSFYVIIPGKDYSDIEDELKTFATTNKITVNEISNSEYFYIENKEAGYSAYVEKVDQDGNPVSGAEFTLLKDDGNGSMAVAKDSNGNDIKGVTDANGKISFTGLTSGTYQLKETSVPSGYENTPVTSTTFTLDDTNKTYTYQAKNTKIYGTWTINKTDADDVSKKLQGVVFGLYDESNNLLESKTTDANGQVVFEKLNLNVAYTVKEITPLDGYLVNNTVYSISNTPNKTFTVNYASEITNVENTKEKGSIQITKYEADANGDPTTTELSGAVYTLYDSNKKPITDENGIIVTATTDASGIAKFENLKWDTYYVRETMAPSGYAIDTAYYVANVSSDTVVTMDRTNAKLSTVAPFVSFKFQKLGYNPNGTSSVPLPGAVYELYNINDTRTPVATAISDSNGYVHFMNITYASDNSGNASTFYDFYIKEESAPTGYVLSGEQYSIDIDAEFVTKYGNTNEFTNATKDNIEVLDTLANTTFKGFVNYEYEGEIQVVKTAEDGTTPLSGAKFEIYKNGSTSASGVVITDANGEGTFTGLEYGATYTVKEVEPPAGYKLSTQSFEVTIGDTINASNPSVKSVYNGIFDNVLHYNADFANDPLSLSISKRAITGTEEVYGAKLTLKKLDGTLIDSWTSGSTAHIISADKLKTREVYVLTETAAPDGYGYSESIIFTINDDGSIDITSGGTEANNLEGTTTVIMKDKAIDVTLSKIDAVTGSALNNATLQLTDTSGNVLHQWTYSDLKISSTNAATFGIKPAATVGTYNEYIFREHTAPAGYHTAEDIHFYVDYYGDVFLKSGNNYVDVSTMGDTITMSDVPETGAVVFSKVALVGGTELSGATITITDSVTKLVTESWTSTNVAHTMNTSKFVKNRDYIFTETNAPTGYAYAESITFRITSDGKVEIKQADNTYAAVLDSKIQMIDNAIDISVSKVDDEGTPVTNATINLYDNSNGKLLHSFKSTATVEEIGAYITAGAPGAYKYYRLVEADVPFGYAAADPVMFGVDAKGQVHLYNAATNSYDLLSGNAITITDNRKFISISKWDIANDKELSGAKLSITGADGTDIAWTSLDTAHQIPMKELKPDVEYTLTETSAPKGYTVAESMMFKFDADGTLSVKTDVGYVVQNGTLITMKDDVIDVSVLKVDEDNNPLEKATLKLYDANGVELTTITSTKTAQNIGSLLTAGTGTALSTYTLKETVAPYGYALAEQIKFALDKNGAVYLYNEATGAYEPSSTNTITIVDKKAYVYISKVDFANKKELPGAKLTITSADGTLAEWTSTDVKHSILMSEFKPGVEYTLTEITAPDGYEKAESIVFMIDNAGVVAVKIAEGYEPVTDNTVVMEDKAIITSGETTTTTETTATTETTESKPTPPTATSDSTATTGDTAPIDMVFILMLMSALGIVVIGSRRKKHSSN